MPLLFLDTETYCETDLKTAGLHRYAEDAEIIMWQWAVDEGEVQVRDADEDLSELVAMLLDPAYTIVCHNSAFDRTVMRHNGLDIPVNRWHDTMVRAFAHSLPGSLGELGEVLGVAEDSSKDKSGIKLIRMFSMPQRSRGKNEPNIRFDRDSHPFEWKQFREYGRRDITALRAVYNALPKWNYAGHEYDIWCLDQRINDRGFAVDVDLAQCALRAAKRAKQENDDMLHEASDGAVQSSNKREQLLAYILQEYGVPLPDLRNSTLERAISEGDIPAGLSQLLALRLQGSKNSPAKYRRLVKGVSSDGRLRGTLQFCGAIRTGRWAGRVFQPQNLPRPTLSEDAIDRGITAMKHDAEDLVDIGGTVMDLCASALRGTIIAPPGRKLVVADLSNIEGRVLAWLAGEEWKLQAFREFDAGTGHDLYALAYAKSFGVSPEVVMVNKKDGDGSMRQIGKTQELALGYAGGVGAFLTFANAFNIDLEAMAGQALASIPAWALAESHEFLDWRRDKGLGEYGLSENAFVVCESFKRLWRDAHPMTVAYWKGLEDTCKAAVENPGDTYTFMRHKMRRVGAWLRISLPSGRCLCYPNPLVGPDPNADPEDKRALKIKPGQLSYKGKNQYTRKWERIITHGGKLAENTTQAVARDILAYRLPAVEEAGYEIGLLVHDEIVSETPDSDEFSADRLAALMASDPGWAEGLPLAAAGFEAYRYKK